MRERKEDILLLVNHFAGRMAVELGWAEIPQFSPDAVRALEEHPWPGNVRELKNVVERAVYRSDSPRITEIVFDPFISPYDKKTPEIETEDPNTEPASPDLSDLMAKPLKEAVWGLKLRMLDNALVRAKFNQKKAARLLGLTYHQFRGLYRQYKRNEEP